MNYVLLRAAKSTSFQCGVFEAMLEECAFSL